MSAFNRLAGAIAARRTTILVWAILLLVVFGVVSYNHAAQARTAAALASTSASVRDGAVRGLVQNGRLSDALAATEDINGDPKDPQNVQSAALRENAADSVNRLAAAHQVTDAQALDTLFQLRKDSDSGVKDKATAGLVTLGTASGANLRAIVGNLGNGDPDLRSAAVDALSKIGGDKVAKLVDPLMRDPAAGDSAQSVMQALGPTAVPYVVAHLSTPDLDFRQKMLNMLGQIGSPLAVPPLVQVAADPDPSVRRLALASLASTVLNNFSSTQKATLALRAASADPKTKPADVQKAQADAQKAAAEFAQTRAAAPALIAALRDPEADSQARTQAALALGRIGGGAAIAALVGALGDYDALVRSAALQGVQSAGPGAVGPLTAALAQGTPDTRAAAAQALGGIGSPASLATLAGLLRDPATPVAVRRAAVQGLGQSGSISAITPLVAALADPDGGVAGAASDALLTPGLEAAAVPALVAAFARPAPAPFNASQTLSRMGNLAVPALRAAAAAPAPQMQTWAAVTLGATDSKDPAILASLAPLTRSADPQVQYAAAQAVERLSGT